MVQNNAKLAVAVPAIPGLRAASKPKSQVQFAPEPRSTAVAMPPPAAPTQKITSIINNTPHEQSAQVPGINSLTIDMAHVKIAARIVPSLAPAPSYASVKTRFAPSQYPNDIKVSSNNKHPMAKAGWMDKGVCLMSAYTSTHFRQGDVVSAPYHVANMDPGVDITKKELRITAHGPVFTKRRTMIVLWKATNAMFYLPLVSWQGGGIAKQDTHPGALADFVCVFNWQDRLKLMNNGKKTGPHRPVLFVHRHIGSGIDPATVCPLIGGQLVQYSEDIAMVGRITQSSYNALFVAWTDRNKLCWQERNVTWPKEGEQDPRDNKLNLASRPCFLGGLRAPSQYSQHRGQKLGQ